MTFCGFNKNMLAGLALFGKGLWEQAQKRAHDDGVTIERSVKNELGELDAFLAVLRALPPSSRTDAITGAALFARYLYEAADGGVGHDEMQRRFAENSARFGDFLRRMDDTYYYELLPGSTQAEALREIGVWILAH